MPPVSQGLSVICRPRGNQAQGKVAGKAEAGSGETVHSCCLGFPDTWPGFLALKRSFISTSSQVCLFFFFLSIYYLAVPGLSYGTRSL